MGRTLRAHLPGVAFHITARTQGKAAHFKEIERLVTARIWSAAARSDAQILAFAVMPNHIHIVALQGADPLSALMQPLLSRVAHLIRDRHGVEGHVFERRFRARACTDPDYFRNAIAYVHLNGYRAGLCGSLGDYPWCSHAEYLTTVSSDYLTMRELAIENAIRVFARSTERSIEGCVADYLSFLQWRINMDAYLRCTSADCSAPLPYSPQTAGGDLYWQRNFAAAVVDGPTPRRRKADLCEIAKETILDMCPEMEIDLLRDGGRARPVVRVRQRFILRAHQAGHRGFRIARFLNISPGAVSLALTKSRLNETI